MAEPLLSLHGIRKSYAIGTPTETEVLHGISLELRRGEFCALIGPSGSGKSTLLNAVMGVLPLRGRVGFDGEDTARLEIEDRVALANDVLALAARIRERKLREAE